MNLSLQQTLAQQASRLRRLAEDEAQINRAELEKLYDHATQIVGELRYHYLWRVAQLERTCSRLDKAAQEQPANYVEAGRLRAHISRLALQAVELRQEAGLLLNTYLKAAAARAQAKAAEAAFEPMPIPAMFHGW